MLQFEWVGFSWVRDGLRAQANGHFFSWLKKYDDDVLVDTTRFVRGGLLPVQERDGTNNVTSEYTWGLNMGGGIGGLLNLKQAEQDYSYLYDGKGNVTSLLDSSESVVATYAYDTFGNLMSSTGGVDQPFRFSTKRYDESLGISYYGYRFYSPALRRWINRDPLGERGGINLYGFVQNNPVNFIDPSGLDTWSGAGVTGEVFMWIGGVAYTEGWVTNWETGQKCFIRTKAWRMGKGWGVGVVATSIWLLNGPESGYDIAGSSAGGGISGGLGLYGSPSGSGGLSSENNVVTITPGAGIGAGLFLYAEKAETTVLWCECP